MRNYRLLILFAGLAVVCLASQVQAGEIDPNAVVVTASSEVCCDPNQVASHVIDHSGMIWASNDFGVMMWMHDGTDPETMWLSGKKADSEPNVNPGTVTGTHWIRFDLDKVYRMDKIMIWNYALDGTMEDFGMHNVTVEYSETGGSSPTEWEVAFEGTFDKCTGYTRDPLPAWSDTTVLTNGALMKSIVFTSPVVATAGPGWNFYTPFIAYIQGKTEVGLAEVKFYATEPTTCNEVIQFGFGLEGDMDRDCYVTLTDFADAVSGWLDCVEPGDAGCTHPWEL